MCWAQELPRVRGAPSLSLILRFVEKATFKNKPPRWFSFAVYATPTQWFKTSVALYYYWQLVCVAAQIHTPTNIWPPAFSLLCFGQRHSKETPLYPQQCYFPMGSPTPFSNISLSLLILWATQVSLPKTFCLCRGSWIPYVRVQVKPPAVPGKYALFPRNHTHTFTFAHGVRYFSQFWVRRYTSTTIHCSFGFKRLPDI